MNQATPGFRSYIARAWAESKWYRVGLIAAGVYFVIRLLGHFAFIGDFFPDDLRIYLDAAQDLLAQEPLYPPLPLEHQEMYQYAPTFALVFAPLTWMPRVAAAVLFSLAHIALYALLYVWWDRIFARLGFEHGRTVLARTLPLWLIWTAFWSDMAYLNVYLIMALVGTLLLDAVLREDLGWAVLWLSIILQIKPQWAFPVGIALLLGRYRFFLLLVGAAAAIYTAIAGLMLLFGGDYIRQQYALYYELLREMTASFPWRGPDSPFLGYNHSVMQTVIYLAGDSPPSRLAATALKVLILLPLGVIAIRCLMQPARQPGYEAPFLSLDLAFALYTAAYIWLDIVWELALGIAVFVYLLATLQHRAVKTLLWIVFLPYALVDVIQFVSYLALGDAVFTPEDYVLTDPSIYLPLILMLGLVCHGVLVWRLWNNGQASRKLHRSGGAGDRPADRVGRSGAVARTNTG